MDSYPEISSKTSTSWLYKCNANGREFFTIDYGCSFEVAYPPTSNGQKVAGTYYIFNISKDVKNMYVRCNCSCDVAFDDVKKTFTLTEFCVCNHAVTIYSEVSVGEEVKIPYFLRLDKMLLNCLLEGEGDSFNIQLPDYEFLTIEYSVIKVWDNFELHVRSPYAVKINDKIGSYWTYLGDVNEIEGDYYIHEINVKFYPNVVQQQFNEKVGPESKPMIAAKPSSPTHVLSSSLALNPTAPSLTYSEENSFNEPVAATNNWNAVEHNNVLSSGWGEDWGSWDNHDGFAKWNDGASGQATMSTGSKIAENEQQHNAVVEDPFDLLQNNLRNNEMAFNEHFQNATNPTDKQPGKMAQLHEPPNEQTSSLSEIYKKLRNESTKKQSKEKKLEKKLAILSKCRSDSQMAPNTASVENGNSKNEIHTVAEQQVEYFNKILNGTKYTDVVFVNDKKEEVRGLRCFLAQVSPVLEAVFTSSNEFPVRVEVGSFDEETIKNAIQFSYGNSIGVKGIAIDLFKFAKKYEMNILIDRCLAQFAHNLTVHNVCAYINLAYEENHEVLKKKCLAFLKTNKLSINADSIKALPQAILLDAFLS